MATAAAFRCALIAQPMGSGNSRSPCHPIDLFRSKNKGLDKIEKRPKGEPDGGSSRAGAAAPGLLHIPSRNRDGKARAQPLMIAPTQRLGAHHCALPPLPISLLAPASSSAFWPSTRHVPAS